MAYRIVFKGFRESSLNYEGFVVVGWPGWLKELAEHVWNKNFAHSPELYELIQVPDEQIVKPINL
jgi:hypothetical protein